MHCAPAPEQPSQRSAPPALGYADACALLPIMPPDVLQGFALCVRRGVAAAMLGGALGGKRERELGDPLRDDQPAQPAGVFDQGSDGTVLGQVRGAEGLDAALGRGLGQTHDEDSSQPHPPPGGPDRDRDVRHALTGRLIPGQRHAAPGNLSMATSANRRT